MSAKRRAEGPARTRATRKKRPQSGQQGRGRSRTKTVLLWLLVAGLVAATAGTAAAFVVYQRTEIPDPNADFLTETSHIYYSDGETELGTFAVQRRDKLSYDEMPECIKQAVVAAENRTFWTDRGIDPKGIIRAAFSNAQGNATQGASTITQQYVKILYLTQEQTLERKVKEAFLSLKIQNEVSKQEILEGYLNTIYFGRGAYGIEAASHAFFAIPAKDLDVRQCATLASVLNNPSGLDPANGKEAKAALQERYDYVVGSMADMEYISEEKADKIRDKLPKFPKQQAEDSYGGQRGHVLTMVRKELLALGFTEEDIAGGGLEVTTTLTPKAMQAAEDGALSERPEGFGDKELHTAVASVEPGTGAIRGFYGGQDFLQSEINWAVAGGQAGSILKPFAVATGLKQGYSLKSTFDGNSPFEAPDGTEFENQGDRDYGSNVSLVKATEDSINTAFIDLTLALEDGPESIIGTANDMGIPPAEAKGKNPPGFPSESPGLEPNTGVALGSATVSPINMANAYATIANGGEYAEPFLIEKVVDRNGETRYDHKVVTDRAISEDIAADTSYALQQVVKSGSGTAALDLGRPAAGKTGTSTNSQGDVVSAWFTGYTPQLATSVLYVRGEGVGKLDGWLPEYFGGSYPARTWTAVMDEALDGEPIEEFPPPAWVEGDPPSDDHEPYTPPPKPTKTKTPETESPTPTPTPSKTPGPPTESPTKTPGPKPSCWPLCPTDTTSTSPSPSPTETTSTPAGAAAREEYDTVG